MDQGPAGLIPTIQEINAPRGPLPQPAAPTPQPSAGADTWLASQRQEHPEQWSDDQSTAEEEARIAALREQHGVGETIGTKFVQGALDALLAPGALAGFTAETTGELLRNKALRDFGRGLGEASSGRSAMEAFAGLASAALEGSAYKGAEYADLAKRQLEETEAARPMLSTISRMAGMSALAVTGGLASSGEVAAAANIGMNAAEGAAGGAQGAYERGAPLRDVLGSVAIGGMLGGAIAGAAEGATALVKKTPDLAKVFGEKLQTFADKRAIDAATGGNRKVIGEILGAGPERVERVANRIRAADIIGKGDQGMLEALDAGAKDAGAQLGAIAEQLDKAGIKPNIGDMRERLLGQVAELRAAGSGTLNATADSIEREIEPFMAKLRVQPSNIEPELKEASERGLEEMNYLRSGMREESLARVREEFASGKQIRPVEVAKYPDGMFALQDGRHRMTIAKELGIDELPAKIRVYDDDLNITKEINGTLPIRPRRMETATEVAYRDPTFTELRTFKQALGAAKSKHMRAQSLQAEELKSLYSNVAQTLDNAADTAGPAIGQQWRNANEAATDFIKLRDGLEAQLIRREQNRFISPSDYGTSIGAGLATLIHTANPVAAGAAAIGTALFHKAARQGGSALFSNLANRFARMSRHVSLSAAGGPEAQEILSALGRTKAFMEDTAARAGANPTLQQTANETAKNVAADQLVKKAGQFDPVTWYAKPLSPLQKVLYRSQLLDHASNDLAKVAEATAQLRPPIPGELDARRLARLVRGGDATTGIGSLQSLVADTAKAAPPTPTGEAAGVALRNLGLGLETADPVEAIARTHEAANWLMTAAEHADDDVSQQFVTRAEQALRSELSDPAHWGQAGEAYGQLTGAPAQYLEHLSDPAVVRDALRSGEVPIASKLREAQAAIQDAHDAAFKLTGQRVTASNDVKQAMSRAQKLFDAAEEATQIDGKPMSALFSAARASGVYETQAAQEVNEQTVQKHVEQGLDKLTPALKSAAMAKARVAVGSQSVSHELTRSVYDQRLKALADVNSQPDQHQQPGMYAGVAPFIGEKLQQLLNDMPKPIKSIHGSQFDSLSRDDMRLANAMWEATTEPMSVFHDLAAGSLDPDKASYAWKQYPGLQQAAQAGTLDVILHDLTPDERTKLPGEILTQLDAALGFQGRLQDANMPDFAARMSQLYQPAPNKPSPGGMLETPAAEPSFTERLAGAK